tara:strand:+ start:565 stop:1329 length:765 start_codon:yes stop_codon:yes gene_type:complete
MKNKFAMSGIFLITYLVFLIATLPTTFVLNQISLPTNIKNAVQFSGVTGSIWQTDIAQMAVNGSRIEKVHAELSFWSLFSLTPKLTITFGDSFSAGPEGKAELLLSQNKATVNDLKLFIKANEVAQQLTLPLPVTAQGNVELTVINADIDLKNNNQCLAVKGDIAWSKAGVEAFNKNIKLDQLNADIGCENGALTVIISPKNDLGLTFTAYVRQGGKVSGNGFLKPGAKFPVELNDALPFLGRKDNQGRYRLAF